MSYDINHNKKIIKPFGQVNSRNIKLLKLLKYDIEF